MQDIELTKTDRQLLLYDIFRGSQQISLEDITSRLPVNKKMIQRDIEDLTAAGLIRIKYSRKEKAYIKDIAYIKDTDYPLSLDEGIKEKRRIHLTKLRRIGILMTQLCMDNNSDYWDDKDDYFSCKKCYYQLFPDSTERMRQRDFAQLNRIGYWIRYDNYDRRYKMWESNELREDFGVYKKNGKLLRHPDEIYNVL